MNKWIFEGEQEILELGTHWGFKCVLHVDFGFIYKFIMGQTNLVQKIAFSFNLIMSHFTWPNQVFIEKTFKVG